MLCVLVLVFGPTFNSGNPSPHPGTPQRYTLRCGRGQTRRRTSRLAGHSPGPCAAAGEPDRQRLHDFVYLTPIPSPSRPSSSRPREPSPACCHEKNSRSNMQGGAVVCLGAVATGQAASRPVPVVRQIKPRPRSSYTVLDLKRCMRRRSTGEMRWPPAFFASDRIRRRKRTTGPRACCWS
jgi:hypothetical protein